METLTSWILSLILSIAPLSQPVAFKAAQETEVERQARYEAITKDLLAVVYDTNEAPLFKGPKGRAQTATVLLAVASFESGFRKDVDFGLGTYSKGDSGSSWCMMQVRLGAAVKGKTQMRINLLPNGLYDFTFDPAVGYGGEDLVKDRQACFRAGLHLIRNSMKSCSSLPTKSKLRVYASGSTERGEKESVLRMGRAADWWSKTPPPFMDEEAFAWLKPAPVETVSLILAAPIPVRTVVLADPPL